MSLTQLEKGRGRIGNWSAWLQSLHLTIIMSLSVFSHCCEKKVTNQVADKHQKCIHMVLKGGKPKSRAAAGLVSGEGPCLHAENVFCVHSYGRVTELPWASCIKATIPKLL